MLYLAPSPSHPQVRWMLDNHELGLMVQPASNLPQAGWVWAADNGCFTDSWSEEKWLRFLAKPHPRSGCLFATVPDVVADHEATLERFFYYAGAVRDAAYPVAFVAQDGSEDGEVPWREFDALFIGGSTAWKMSQAAFELAMYANEKGKWVHVGRVNSIKRLAYWSNVANSADGTHLKYEPDVAAPRVRGWVMALRRGTQLSLVDEGGQPSGMAEQEAPR